MTQCLPHLPRRLGIAALCLVCAVYSKAYGDPTTGVPLNHSAYPLIDRFEARGWLRPWGNGTRPMSRLEVARALSQILERAKKGDGLSEVELQRISRLTVEFGPELRTLGEEVRGEPPGVVGRLRGGGHLGWWEGKDGHVSMDVLFRQQALTSSGENVSQTHVGGIVEGTVKGFVGFRLRHWEARQQGNRPIRSRQDIVGDRVEFVEVKGKSADFREATAQMVLGTPWLDLEVGKDFEQWGPTVTGGLLLSDNAPSYPLLKMRARYGRVKFVHLIGFLRSGLIDTARTFQDNGFTRTFERKKHFSAHRVEVGLKPGVTVGLQEIVIYGDRGVEFAYAVPATFLIAAQSFLGDKDNTAVGLDLDAGVIPNLRVYGSLFLDDLTKFGGSGAFSNKYALQAGLLWVDPLGWRDSELRAEFVHIEPWVYTHLFNINRYQHDHAILGNPLGPNSDGVYGEVSHRITGSLSFQASASLERHGANPVLPDGTILNVGGDANLGQRPGDDVSSKRFLAGIRERRTRYGVKSTFEPALDFFLEVGYRRLNLLSGGTSSNRNEWSAVLSYNFL